MDKPPCSHPDGCAEPSYVRGLCIRHYRQQQYRANAEKVKERARRWREQNAERKRALDEQWRKENAERKRETDRRWREANQEHRRATAKLYYKRESEERAAARKVEYAALKEQALLAYGDGSCAGCGSRPEDIRKLEICFPDGDGGEYREQITGRKTGRSMTFWARLRELDWPRERRIVTLCAKCRRRQVQKRAPGNAESPYRRLRRQALLAYGDGSCAICGERPEDVLSLEMDHVNGDGAEHRRELGDARGYTFLAMLRRDGWPTTHPIQTLCATCHSVKSELERAKARLRARAAQQ